MTQFLNAKDVAYDRPGSVANYYGWSPATINSVYAKATGDGSTKNQQNMAKHVSKFLDKRGLTMDTAKPNMMVHAMDYAYREEGRKQQTKGGGFLDFLKKFAGPVAGAILLPGIGGALGAGISAGVGGAIGGAIQGGVENGFKGAALGGLSGYGIGSGIGAAQNWASNALGGAQAGAQAGAGQGFSYGGDVVGAAGRLPSTLPANINAASFAGTPGVGQAGNWLGGAAGRFSYGGDVVGAAKNLPQQLPPNIDAQAFSRMPGVGIADQVMGGFGQSSAMLRNSLNAAGNIAGLFAGGQQAQGPNAAPGSVQSPQGPTAPGFASVPSAQPGAPQGQGFDATLVQAAGKMPQNALAMNSMGSGGLGMSDRDRYRNPGYQPPPFANFLRM